MKITDLKKRNLNLVSIFQCGSGTPGWYPEDLKPKYITESNDNYNFYGFATLSHSDMFVVLFQHNEDFYQLISKFKS